MRDRLNARTPYPIAVLTAAAMIPYFGIKSRFRVIFVEAAIIVAKGTALVCPVVIDRKFIGIK
jgi:hypothetical protein